VLREWERKNMKKEDIIEKLKEIKPKLVEDGIEKIAIFGSYAKDTNNESSDIDILYQADSKGLNYSQILRLEDTLNNIFNKDIDLVDINYLNPLIKRNIEKDLIYV
jgi:predicted nucleotidyltransferase